MSYKWCVVPMCTNTSIKTKEKMFVSVPKNSKIRKKWLMLARRSLKDIAAHSSVYMCEDHFNMEQDMINYLKYKMGFSKAIFMGKGVLPSKFDCQKDSRKRLSNTTMSQKTYAKRLKIEIDEETETAADTPGSSTQQDDNSMPCCTTLDNTELVRTCKKGTSTEPIVCAEKQVQATFKIFHRSKAMQTKIPRRDVAFSPYKVHTTSTMSSPYKPTKTHIKAAMPAPVTNIMKKISFHEEEGSDDISSFTETDISQDSSTFVAPSSEISDSDVNVTDILYCINFL